MQEEGLDAVVLQKLGLPNNTDPDLTQWNQFLNRHKNPKHEVNIGLIGKYVELQDSYKSILESLIHAGAANEVRVNVRSIHSEHLSEKNLVKKLNLLDGVLVAPGFGKRGIIGKIRAVQYARENGIPFLGICLGMQMAVIEYARNILGLKDANSTEMDASTSDPVISLMEEQKDVVDLGGTMRLGAWDCELAENSLVHRVYNGTTSISERHRHRYEFNNAYKAPLEEAGLMASGINKETGLVEIIELANHPWFIGVQYHPEYKSTVANPHPLFVGFVKAALAHKLERTSAVSS
jgi:CTP synthase